MNRPDATLDVPIDPDTVGETIRRALQLGTGRPDLGELSAMHCALRAHISHLLPAARTSAARLPQGAVTASMAGRWIDLGGDALTDRRPRLDALLDAMREAAVQREVL